MDDSSDNQHDPLEPADFYNGKANENPNIKGPKSRQSDILKKLLSKAETSVPYNFLKVTVPFLTLLATTLVLTLAHEECEAKLNFWFYLMAVNDAMAVILRSLVLYNLIQMNKTRKSDSLIPDLLNLQSQDLRYQNILYGSSSLILTSSQKFKKREKAKKALMVIWWLKVMFYFGLIVYGQYLYINAPPCGEKTLLALMYLIMGYLYMVTPTLVFIVCAVLFRKGRCNPCCCLKNLCKKPKMTKSELKKLKSEKFQGDLPGYHECGVCNKPYKEGENIVMLGCDETHHFHEKCIKNELKKTNICPICGWDIKSEVANASFSVAGLNDKSSRAGDSMAA